MSKKIHEFDDPEATPGVISKSVGISSLVATEDDLKKINKYTLEPVTAEEVFVFKATLCDNEQDDRNFMPFDARALKHLKKLYPGKTMIRDHQRSAAAQIARVYDTELIETEKLTALGEKHMELIGKMYMIKTASNADLIAEIRGGIKKEVSTGTVPEKMICNICKTDNMVKYCRHWPGRKYTVEDGSATGKETVCQMLLSGAKEAYELSFVAVPAQPRAGTHKSVGFVKPVAETEDDPQEGEHIDKTAEISLRTKIAESYNFISMSKEDN